MTDRLTGEIKVWKYYKLSRDLADEYDSPVTEEKARVRYWSTMSQIHGKKLDSSGVPVDPRRIDPVTGNKRPPLAAMVQPTRGARQTTGVRR
ncbi:MAG: hypothetical protein Q4G50_08180 [Corynebacterium sp.]|uniref:hypothetical protein n=1 Tax=Corynebacterium sp. TaxID=1720 RepID=UPI0026DF1E7F|nr:hypothetical protein [Corynebacterium sp.]MDO5669966.1 hypothetical protein [Corynebacterium sp.]